jgi:hypothetical protein
MAQSKPIKNFIRGDSRVVNIQVYQSDGITPFNLTGSTVFFTVNANQDNTADTDSSAVIALKTSTFAQPTSGLATLTITNAMTQDITPGTYYYDVQVKDGSGNVMSLQQSQFIVIADVTRSIS